MRQFIKGRVGRCLLCVPVVSLLALAPSTAGSAIEEVRGEFSDIYVRADAGDEVRFRFGPAAGPEKDRMQLVVFDPAGRKVTEFQPLVGRGSWVYTFDTPGDWRFRPLCSGERLSVESLTGSPKIVLCPRVPHRPVLKLDPGESATLFFNVPAGAGRFSIHGSSVYGTCGTIRLKNQEPVATVTIPQFTSSSGAGYDESHTAVNPVAGVWSIEVTNTHQTDAGYLGFWLKEVPNYFSDSPGRLFEPVFNTADATVVIYAANTSDIGDLLVGANGGNWNITPAEHQTIAGRFGEMGFNFSRPHALVRLIEIVNDNADRSEINWAGFDFNPLYAEMENLQVLYGARSIVTLYHEGSWMGNIIENWPDEMREEFAEFCLACVIYLKAPDLIPAQHYRPRHGPYRIDYFECMNEPNWLGSGEQSMDLIRTYADIFSKVVTGIRAHPDPRVSGVRIGGPCVSSWGGQKTTFPLWIRELVRHPNVGAHANPIIWHTYDWFDLQHKDDFLMDVSRARTAVGEGGFDPGIFDYVITETNIHGWIPSNQEMQDTQYASLWMVNALIQSVKGGIDGLIFYSLHDDTDRAKGLMYGNNDCYGGGRSSYYCDASDTEPYQLRPAGRALKAVMERMLPCMAKSSSSHSQISEFCTLDEGPGLLNIVLTNIEEKRSIDTALSVHLPESMADSVYRVTACRIDEANPAPIEISGEVVSAGQTLDLSIVMAPWSICFVDCVRIGPLPTETPTPPLPGATPALTPMPTATPLQDDAGRPAGDQAGQQLHYLELDARKGEEAGTFDLRWKVRPETWGGSPVDVYVGMVKSPSLTKGLAEVQDVLNSGSLYVFGDRCLSVARHRKGRAIEPAWRNVSFKAETEGEFRLRIPGNISGAWRFVGAFVKADGSFASRPACGVSKEVLIESD